MMNKGQFAGTKAVFRFTLGQYLKSRSTIITMIVLLVSSVASLLVATLSMSNGVVESTELLGIQIVDEAGLSVQAEDVCAADELLAQLPVGVWQEEEEARLASGWKTALVTVRVDEFGALAVHAKAFEDGQLSDGDLSRAANAVLSAAEKARSRALAGDEAQIALLTAPVSVSTSTLNEYYSPSEQKEDMNFDTRYLLTFIYSILLMMLVSFSSSYIVRAVIEEKASRLVETLMVSVQPMALIIGKILASMCLVAIQLLLLVAGFAGSWFMVTRVLQLSNVQALFAQTNVGAILSGLDVGMVLVFVVSVLVAYAFYALLAGLAGVRCSNMEDVESANVSIVLTSTAGYITSVSTSALGGGAATALSLIPVVNVFVAPVRYLLGEIGLSVLLLSWLIQLVCIALLAIFCHRVYGALLMRRGSKVRLRDLLAMAGRRKGEAA